MTRRSWSGNRNRCNQIWMGLMGRRLLVVLVVALCASCATMTTQPHSEYPVVVVGYLNLAGDLRVSSYYVERSDIEVNEETDCISAHMSLNLNPMRVVREHTGRAAKLYGKFVNYREWIGDDPWGGMFEAVQNDCGNEHILLIYGVGPS
jgi:hypothetical protein